MYSHSIARLLENKLDHTVKIQEKVIYVPVYCLLYLGFVSFFCKQNSNVGDFPWWCNAARTFCKGGQDPCCIDWWKNPMEACYACQNYCGGC